MGRMQRGVWKILNASLTYNVIESAGFIDENGYPQQSMAHVLTGEYDAFSNVFPDQSLWKNQIYLQYMIAVCYITPKEKLYISKTFLDVFPLNAWMLLSLTFSLIIMSLKFSLKINLSESLLEALRGILGVSMLRYPNSVPQRILYTVFLHFFIVMNCLIQSRLNAMIISPTYSKIETIEDVINQNYDIYAADYYKQFYNSSITKYIKPIDHFVSCFEMMQKDDKVACLNECIETKYFAHETKKVHISQDIYLKRHGVYIFKNDFSLLKRFQSIYTRLYEAGMLIHYINKEYSLYHSNKYFHIDSPPISLLQIQFAFYFLVIASICNMNILLVEIFFNLLTGKKNLLSKCCFS